MAFAALCSQRPLREAKSRFTLAMAFALPKCMLAVYQPMSSFASHCSKSAVALKTSISREKSELAH